MNIESLDSKSILFDNVFSELMDEEDIITKTRMELELEDRAKELGVKTKFDTILKAYKKQKKKMDQEEKQNQQVSMVENFTNFDGPYESMFCGSWIAGDSGVLAQTSGGIDQIACYHPILPVERLKNLETGDEQIKLAYKRNHKWSEIIVPKTLIASANKIVGLSAMGIAVTSENAKLLVKYLADLENGNDDYIKVQYSTSKLGWIKDDFIPYDKAILFDGDSRFKTLFESVTDNGSYEKWKAHMIEIRASGRMEVKFMLASSFASVLVKMLDCLPFVSDLWGETEGGKTVALMVAASVWANPAESQYIGDLKSTDVALEAKSDMLNNLPLILDDTSKTSARIRDNFEGVVYDLCSGKGKSRSNKELGINRENHWQNCIITNGERPLSGYVNQGGAINRILEFEAPEKIFDDPQKTAAIIKKNYGHAGKEFVQIVKDIGTEKLKEIQNDFQNKIYSDKSMQKQMISLSVVLTADKIATDHIFKDGNYIDLNDAKQILVNYDDLSDNERCYQYIVDKIAMNPQRFDSEVNCEQWGMIEGDYAVIYSSALESLCKEKKYSKSSFLSWADKKCLLETEPGRTTKLKKINGVPRRCVFLNLEKDTANSEMKANNSEYLDIDGEIGEIPF